MTHDVVIVGGGPNGLLTACELALGGVPHPVVLEAGPEPSTEPRANGLVGRVVEALDRRGLYGLFSGSAEPPAPAPYFPFAGLILDMAGWAGNALHTLPLPQARMVELLTARALDLGVEIRRGHRLTDLRQDPEAVTAEVDAPDGPYRLTARHLVGADGGHSLVRKLGGIGFPGTTDHGFVSISGEVAIHPPVAVPGGGDLDIGGDVGRLHPASFTRTERGVFAYGMFRPGVYRVSVLEWGRPPAESRTDLPIAELRDAVERVLGRDVPMSALPADTAPAHVRAVTGVNSRVAERYRDGRVLLVGDAAHVQSGVGGPGLNLGLQDALNLGWKLAAVTAGWAPPGLLDTYEQERRPVAERVIMHSRAQMALLSPGPDVTALRTLMGELLQDQSTVRHISDLMSEADTVYRADGGTGTGTHPLTGRWMPDLILDLAGRPTRIAELARSARPLLLDLAPGDGGGEADLAAVAGAWADRVDHVRADAVAAPAGAPAAGAAPAAAVLVRPDGYVAWAADARTAEAADGLRRALAAWFGTPVG